MTHGVYADVCRTNHRGSIREREKHIPSLPRTCFGPAGHERTVALLSDKPISVLAEYEWPSELDADERLPGHLRQRPAIVSGTGSLLEEGGETTR